MRIDPVPMLGLKQPTPPLGSLGPVNSKGQILRAGLVLALFACAFLLIGGDRVRAASNSDASFKHFVEGVWVDAAHLGVSRQTFDAAFAGVTPDPAIVAKTEKQAEFVKPIGDYLASAVSNARIEKGRAQHQQWSAVLDKIEATYGVDRYVVLAVWGMETNYGGFTGNTPVIRALATLAHAGYRTKFFRGELLKALQILEAKHVSVAEFTGSWAGAMGQTQFMPSSFMKFAVDYDGDGHKNIWTNVPDALASTANYLAKNGWERDVTWGYEAIVPPRADLSALSQGYHHFNDWIAAGLIRADGSRMPTEGEAMLLQPAGSDGPTFLVTHNFKIIRTYNNSMSYALGVALLSDRVAGQEPLRQAWPIALR